MNIPVAILNQLNYGRTANGAVGCRVAPTGDNPANHAWLKARARKSFELIGDLPHEIVRGYEVEYLELRAEYDEELHGSDHDLFYVRRETVFNLKDEAALAQALSRWLTNLQQLRPLISIDHPAWHW